MKTNLIATSPTREGLTRQVQSYFYNGQVFFTEEGEVHNSTGRIRNFRVIHKAKRWRFERIPEGQ